MSEKFERNETAVILPFPTRDRGAGRAAVAAASAATADAAGQPARLARTSWYHDEAIGEDLTSGSTPTLAKH